ncbi:MAG: SIMPL domain-containing protein [Marinosulfonomonas sp.]|nr:SIMPL domain-containing protein [Marinosulfonomonas sp.]
MRKLMIALVLLVATPTYAEDVVRRITVVGQGAVETTPDMATVSMGVITEAKTGAEAMAQNSAALEGVLKQLGAAGIEAKDVQTSNLSLSPRWDSSGQGQIAGFIASNTVTVRVRDLDRLGGVLDAVVQNGANTFHGLHFGLQEPQPAQDAARQDAVADARRKAQLYATAAGVTLGDVLTISEAASRGVSPVMMIMEADMMQSRAVPVAQGEVTVGATITIVYAIAD